MLVKQWFNEENVTVMNWPAQSPDLNPLENLWDHLKSFVKKKNPHNVKGLWTSIDEAWNKFPHKRLLKFIDSMPNRCKARGGHTRC